MGATLHMLTPLVLPQRREGDVLMRKPSPRTVRLDETQYRQVAALAKAEQRSWHNTLCVIVSRYFRDHPVELAEKEANDAPV